MENLSMINKSHCDSVGEHKQAKIYDKKIDRIRRGLIGLNRLSWS